MLCIGDGYFTGLHAPKWSNIILDDFRRIPQDTTLRELQLEQTTSNDNLSYFVYGSLNLQKKNLEFWDVFSRFCPNFKPFWKEPTCFKAVAHVRSFAPEATVDGLHPGAFGLKKKTRCLRGRKMCWNLKSLLCVHKWKTGFNPIENISQNGESSPKRGEHGKNIETTT